MGAAPRIELTIVKFSFWLQLLLYILSILECCRSLMIHSDLCTTECRVTEKVGEKGLLQV